MTSSENAESSSLQKRRRTAIWFGIFVALVIALGELRFLPSLLAGIPTYASLDVERGTLAQVGVCAGNRGPHDVPVWLASEAGRRKVWLPCTPDILQLSNRIGTSIEVRSRLVDQIISAPLNDVWSVKADGVDVYSYEARVDRSKGPSGYVLAISYPLLLSSFYAWFAWALIHGRTGRSR